MPSKDSDQTVNSWVHMSECTFLDVPAHIAGRLCGYMVMHWRSQVSVTLSLPNFRRHLSSVFYLFVFFKLLL